MNIIEKSRTVNKRTAKSCLIYTVLFFIMLGAFFIILKEGGKTAIYHGDAMTQHLQIARYMGSYIRNILQGMGNGNFAVPLFDFNIGMGEDVLTSMHYYFVGDPLNLLYTFVPSDQTWLLYSILVFVRIYLAGFAFLIFVKKFGYYGWSAALGGLMYALSSYPYFVGFNHSFFMNGMILLPLLLLGAEKIFRKESPYFFVGFVALGAIVNFYFFYMNVFFVVFYVVVRYFTADHKKESFGFWKTIGIFAKYGVWGVALGAVIFAPVVYELFHSSRAATQTMDVTLFFRPSYYQDFLETVFLPSARKGHPVIGTGVLSVSCFLLLFLEKKKKALKIFAILLLLMLCFPVAGSVLNGFGYSSSRWSYGIIFFLSFVTVIEFEKLLNLQSSQKGMYGLGMLFVSAFYLYQGKDNVYFLGALLLGCTVIPYLKKTEWKKWGIISLALMNLMIPGIFAFKEKEAKFIKVNNRRMYGNHALTKMVTDVVKHDSSFYRITEDFQMAGYMKNPGIMTGKKYANYYISLNNKYIREYCTVMQNHNKRASYFEGMGNNALCLAGTATKYYITSGKQKLIPYGYHLKKNLGRYRIYENSMPLSIGYTFSSYIPKKEYQKMQVEERQQAMLQGVVVEESRLPKTNLGYTDRRIPFTMEAEQGVKIIGRHKLKINKRFGKLKLKLKEQPSGDLYLKIENIKLEMRSHKKQRVQCIIKVNGTKKVLQLWEKNYIYYDGNGNYYLRIASGNIKNRQIEMEWYGKMTCTYDKITLIEQPMEFYEKAVKELSKCQLEHVVFGTNKITGDIVADGEKFLCFSIPYSRGWTLYIDGNKTALQRANILYMGADLPAGKHKIELRYRTPMLSCGLACSIIALIFLLYDTRVKSHSSPHACKKVET